MVICKLNLAAATFSIALAAFAGSVGTLLAQDSLRIIELSEPGESAPLSVPAGHVFTFSLLEPPGDGSSAYARVTYAAPVSFVYDYYTSQFAAPRWFVGPAQVALISPGKARMQLYTIKLPQDVRAGILTAEAPTHTVDIPRGSLLASFLNFSGTLPTGQPAGAGDFIHNLTVLNPKGVVYQIERHGLGRLLGADSLHNARAPASAVLRGFFYDDLDSVYPANSFVGPGTATFSRWEDGTTPIAFYCYRIIPARATFVDTTAPMVTVTSPPNSIGIWTLASFTITGSVTDDVSPTRLSFRIQAPGSADYGPWTSVSLAGGQTTKNWQRLIALPSKGVWHVEVQAFDGANNASTVQTIELTRQ
jgi:hypothetical protein